MKKSELRNLIREEIQKSKPMNAASLFKYFKTNAADWGDIHETMYVKDGNLVVIDGYFYGRERALESIKNYWSPGGEYYEYVLKDTNTTVQIINTFSEHKATGRHKKVSTDGIVGVVLKVN